MLILGARGIEIGIYETSSCIPHPLFPNGSIHSIECYLAVCLLIINYFMCQVNLIAGEYWKCVFVPFIHDKNE